MTCRRGYVCAHRGPLLPRLRARSRHAAQEPVQRLIRGSHFGEGLAYPIRDDQARQVDMLPRLTASEQRQHMMRFGGHPAPLRSDLLARRARPQRTLKEPREANPRVTGHTEAVQGVEADADHQAAIAPHDPTAPQRRQEVVD